MSRIQIHFVQFASYDFSAKKAQKVSKRLKTTLCGQSIPGLVRKRAWIGHIPDTPPDSASRALVPIADPPTAILVLGGAIDGILSAGRSLKILINFCYIRFSPKTKNEKWANTKCLPLCGPLSSHWGRVCRASQLQFWLKLLKFVIKIRVWQHINYN